MFIYSIADIMNVFTLMLFAVICLIIAGSVWLSRFDSSLGRKKPKDGKPPANPSRKDVNKW